MRPQSSTIFQVFATTVVGVILLISIATAQESTGSQGTRKVEPFTLEKAAYELPIFYYDYVNGMETRDSIKADLFSEKLRKYSSLISMKWGGRFEDTCWVRVLIRVKPDQGSSSISNVDSLYRLVKSNYVRIDDIAKVGSLVVGDIPILSLPVLDRLAFVERITAETQRIRMASTSPPLGLSVNYKAQEEEVSHRQELKKK